MIIGIDPGFTGAIAYLDGENLKIFDLPLKLVNGRNRIDAEVFAYKVGRAKFENRIRFAVIEEIGSMPDQGISSTARFNYNAGILYGALAGLGIKVMFVKPTVWKPALGLNRDKKKSLALAKELFPLHRAYFKRVKDDGRAEAALIAHFARECLS